MHLLGILKNKKCSGTLERGYGKLISTLLPKKMTARVDNPEFTTIFPMARGQARSRTTIFPMARGQARSRRGPQQRRFFSSVMCHRFFFFFCHCHCNLPPPTTMAASSPPQHCYRHFARCHLSRGERGRGGGGVRVRVRGLDQTQHLFCHFFFGKKRERPRPGGRGGVEMLIGFLLPRL